MMTSDCAAVSREDPPAAAPAASQFSDGGGVDVVNDDGVSALEQVSDHGLAHDAESDESNFHFDALPFSFVICSRPIAAISAVALTRAPVSLPIATKVNPAAR